MQWIQDIAVFLVFSGILLELISDTKYYKFAKWVAGMILLLQFIKPLTESQNLENRLASLFLGFDYSLGTDRVLEDIYKTDGTTEDSVLSAYKANVSVQIDRLLRTNGLKLVQTELSVAEDGSLERILVFAVYEDKQGTQEILVPTVAPVLIGGVPKNKAVSPMELYIREILAEFYCMEENKIEVVIQEAQ